MNKMVYACMIVVASLACASDYYFEVDSNDVLRAGAEWTGALPLYEDTYDAAGRWVDARYRVIVTAAQYGGGDAADWAALDPSVKSDGKAAADAARAEPRRMPGPVEIQGDIHAARFISGFVVEAGNGKRYKLTADNGGVPIAILYSASPPKSAAEQVAEYTNRVADVADKKQKHKNTNKNNVKDRLLALEEVLRAYGMLPEDTTP